MSDLKYGFGPELWLPELPDSQRRPIKLFAIPFAGGGHGMVRGWEEHLPATVRLCPVMLPGRGPRWDEPPLTRLQSLVALAAKALLPHVGSDFILFGHSMGALLAFEVARQLRNRTGIQPLRLIVAGRGAPHLRDPGPALHAASEATLLAELRRLGGTGESALDDIARMKRILPLIRADFAVCETYHFRDEVPLDCPIDVFGGTDDSDWPLYSLEAWRQHTTQSCEVVQIEGGHFFIQTCLERWLAALRARCEAAIVDSSESRANG